MQDIPPQGSITDIFFPRLVARLHRDGFEGAVRVALGETTKIVYFKRGEIASAASNADADRLASILILEGRLTSPQLDMAKSRPAPGGSLGKTLIDMGFLSPSELLQGARRQVRQIVDSCCALSSGTYQVEPGPLPPEVTVLGVPTGRLIFDTVMQARDRQWIVREMGSMESVYRPTDDLTPGLNVLKLDIEIDQVARMLDGTQTLRDLSARTSLDDFTVSKAVLALEILGMAELIGMPVEAAVGAGIRRTIPIASEGEPAPPEAEGIDLGDIDDDASAIEVLLDESAASEEAGPDPARARPGAETTESDEESSPLPVAGEAEPPPIPREELPAFAAPPGEEPQWQIDPRTGERVHLGPIEMTFDGRVGTARGDRRTLRLVLVAAGAVTIVVAGVAVFLGRRAPTSVDGSPRAAARPLATAAGGTPGDGSGTPTAVPRPPAPETGRGATSAEKAPAAEKLNAAETPPSPPEAAPATGAGRKEESPVEPQVRSTPRTAPPPPAARPPVATPPIEEPPPAPPASLAPPRGSVSPFRESARYAAALHRFDTGDAGGAARIFQELAAAEEPNRYTLQLMIACEVETLKTARARSGEGGSLYFLPFSLKGRDCYRACWGSYATKDEARAAGDGLPRGLLAAGIRPVIVSLGRLRPPSS